MLNTIYAIPTLTAEALGLLKSVIAIASLSRYEEKAEGAIRYKRGTERKSCGG